MISTEPDAPGADSAVEVICTDCEHLNSHGRKRCAACGADLRADSSVDRPAAPKERTAPTREVRLSLSNESFNRLWSVWEILLQAIDPATVFAGNIDWPDGDEPLTQTFAANCARLTEASVSVSPVRLIEQLATKLDSVHAAGVRVNCLQPGSLVVNEVGDLAGIVIPGCMTELLAPAEQTPAGELHCGFTPPELRKFAPSAPGQSTDVYVLALLYHHLSLRRPVDDLMRTGFCVLTPEDKFSPAVRQVLEGALAIDPAVRTASPVEFAKELRRAVAAETAECELIASAAGLSDIGIGGRTSNEDAFVVCLSTTGGSAGTSVRGVVAVADGMGGLRFGDQASRLCTAAVEKAALELTGAFGEDPDSAARERRAAAWAVQVNQSALAAAKRNGSGRNFGSTLTALFVYGAHGFVVHAGDSRLFRLREGTLERLTEIQTYAAELCAKGELTEEEMQTSEFKNTLVNHIGAANFVPQVIALDLRAGDVYLLCTDGPLDGLTTTDLTEVLGSHAPDAAVHELMRRAKQNLLASQTNAPAESSSDDSSEHVSETADGDGTPYSDNLTLAAVRFMAPPQHGDA